MKLIIAIIQPDKLDEVREALARAEVQVHASCYCRQQAAA